MSGSRGAPVSYGAPLTYCEDAALAENPGLELRPPASSRIGALHLSDVARYATSRGVCEQAVAGCNRLPAPPRMRGTQHRRRNLHLLQRTTPAHAGSITSQCDPSSNRLQHPRDAGQHAIGSPEPRAPRQTYHESLLRRTASTRHGAEAGSDHPPGFAPRLAVTLAGLAARASIRLQHEDCSCRRTLPGGHSWDT